MLAVSLRDRFLCAGKMPATREEGRADGGAARGAMGRRLHLVGPLAGVLTKVRQGAGAFLGEKRGCVREGVGGEFGKNVKLGNLCRL